MEASVMIPQAASRPDLVPSRSELIPTRVNFLRRRRVIPSRARVDLGRSRRIPALRAAARAEAPPAVEMKKAPRGRKPALRRPLLFVGLPVDAISEGNTLNHAKAIAAGLKALKLLGVDGVELPIWWGIVEKEEMGKHDWSAYLELAEMIRDAGLQIHASLYFHASKSPAIPLPPWVTRVADADPSIYFADREGRRHEHSLSFAVDDLPVLDGKRPVQIYEAFFHSFQDSFADFIGSTITDVTIGLGPGGELRYPSLSSVKSQKVACVGEFQCYDNHMLALLKQHSERSGKHHWGRSGPHDTPRYDQTPESGNFFKEQGGSWDTPYGEFFLSWYSDVLLSHGDRLLSAATAAFSKFPVTISARIPFAPWWYKTRSHALELTTGYYNTEKRDGYDAVASMFAKHSCKMILTGMDLIDASQPAAFCSSPESLLGQIMDACTRHGVHVKAENSSVSTAGFDRIRSNILDKRPQGKPLIDSFTYQRMGASFFSPEHWPRFTEFIRGISRPELHADDLPSDEEDAVSLSVDSINASTRDSAREMQAV